MKINMTGSTRKRREGSVLFDSSVSPKRLDIIDEEQPAIEIEQPGIDHYIEQEQEPESIDDHVDYVYDPAHKLNPDLEVIKDYLQFEADVESEARNIIDAEQLEYCAPAPQRQGISGLTKVVLATLFAIGIAIPAYHFTTESRPAQVIATPAAPRVVAKPKLIVQKKKKRYNRMPRYKKTRPRVMQPRLDVMDASLLLDQQSEPKVQIVPKVVVQNYNPAKDNAAYARNEYVECRLKNHTKLFCYNQSLRNRALANR